jgi:hypothetical protein
LTFNATVSDDKKIVNCSLWTDYSGSWTLNQTQTVSGTSNVTEFNLINLNNKIFVWNIQCYDNSSQSSWGEANRTVILKLGAAPSSYLETFSVLESADVDVIALDNNTAVLAWVDAATGYNISFQVMNTNGVIITSKTLVDATGGSTSRVSLAPINTTAFVLGIFDQPQNNVDFFVFDRDGNPIVGRTNAAATVGANTDVKICELGDRIPVAYSRTSNGDAELRIYSNEGSLITGTTQIDSSMAPELPSQDIVSCAAINSTAFVYQWFDDGSNDATFVVRSNTGTSIVAATDFDADVGETAQMASASLGNNRFVSAYYDSTDDDITINIRQLSGTTASVVLAATDIDTNAGTDSRLDVAAIQMQNTPNFAVVWIDTSDTTIKAAVYNQSGTQITAPFTVTTTPNTAYPMVKVASYEPIVQTGLCNGTFVVAYTNETEGSLLKKYWYNGSAWDGVCPDYTPPAIVLNQPANNSNITIKSVSFNFTGTDDVSTVLKNCSLWTNFTGSWQINKTIYDVISDLKTNITIVGLNDGLYIWNVQCYDDSSNGAFAPANYTLRINNNTPWIRSQAINATTINQSINIKFNVTITDSFGINSSKVTLRYPNMTEINYTLNNSGNEYYYIFNDTVQLGTYIITLIWTKDNLGQENQNTTPNLQFNVTASPPTEFNLISPANNTESQQLVPTFSWQQTTEANFANYTILVTKDSTFSTIDFTYATYQITNTTFISTYAMDSNTDYYWKVLANDIFENQRNSTQEFRYITDTIGPAITLNTPENNSFWITSNVLFNYTPTDTNSLQSCTLYGNFTGVFARNQTNMSIIKDDYNYFNLNLGEGIYLWTVFCNDTALNGKYASENKTFILDLSGPAINLTSPANNALENNTNNVVFKVNASDKYANLSSCDLLINNTIERTKTAIEHGIENNVEFNFTNFLLNGNYTWRVNCTDTNGFSTLSEIRNISVEVIDHNPPLVSLNYPGINEYVSQNDITFNYTPEDATGIKNCSLYIDGIYNQTNTSNVINFNYNYFTVPNFVEGSHTWRVICYDNSTGLNQGLSNIRTFYIDTENPLVTLHNPGNLTVNPNWYYPNSEYRTMHKIDGSSSGTLTNYSVNIIVHYGAGTNSGNEVYLNSHSKTDFGDIRFVNENNDADLGYYLESKTDSDVASFWVMLPSIDMTNGAYLYIYYGDSSLSTTSNGENAFEFFDDFNNGLDKWTIDPENTDAIIVNSSLGNPSPGLVHLPDSSQTKNAYYDTRMRTKDYKITDGIIDYDIYISGTSRAIHQFGWRVNDLSFLSGYAWRLQTTAADGGFFRFSGGTWTALGSAYPAISFGTWYHVIVNVSSSNYDALVNPGSARSVSDGTKTTGDYLTSHVHATGTDYYVLIDNIRVRKFASSVPESSTWYSEEKRSTLYPEYVTNSLVLFNYTPSDTNLAVCSLYGNFTGTFEEDQINSSPLNNQENIFEKILEDGLYVWNVNCSDLSGRSTFSIYNYSVKVDTTSPAYSNIYTSPENSSAYNSTQIYLFNITWEDNFNISYVIIEENFSGIYQNTTLNATTGTSIYSLTTENLSAGTYYYKWYAEDEAGNKNETETYIYEVVKANSLLELYLNAQQNNITVDETTPVNLNATIFTPTSGYLELYLDEVMINSGASPLINTTTISEPGAHNVTAIYLETQNYSAYSVTYYIIVNDTTRPFIQLISPENEGYIGANVLASLQYIVTDKSDIVDCSLYINDLFNQSNSVIERDVIQYFVVNLSIGDYTWNISCTDNNSNINSSETRSFSAVNINTVKTFVNTTKPQYEKGEIGLIETHTKDVYGNPLITNVKTDIIKGNTTLPWWDASWKYRKQIIINNTVTRDRIETIELNITGLDDNISSCDEIRIVKNSTINGTTVHELLPAEVISGTSTYCLMRFNLELKANSINQGNFFVYYGNPSAGSQGATVTKAGTWVQRGTVTGTVASLTATIDSVSPSKTFVLHTATSTSSGSSLAKFTSMMTVPTEINFQRYGTGTTGTIDWEAITSDDITVQRNVADFASTTSQVNVDISAVDLSKSFIIIDGRVNSGTTANNVRGHFDAQFINSTRIQITRGVTGTAAAAGWQVVEWNNSVVQSNRVSFSATSQTVGVSAVNTSRSILFFSRSLTATGVGSNMVMGNITSSTSIVFEKAYNVGAASVSWFLVELPEEFSVQTNSISMSTDQNIGISTVDYNKAFHTQSWTSTGTTSTTYANTYILADLTSTINILLDKQTTTNTHVVRIFTANTYTGTKGFGEQQQLIQTNTSTTDELGYFPVTLNTSNLTYWNYTAISVAEKEGFTNETKYKVFEVIPDKTAPNITLVSPDDFIERGVGYINFSYIPYDINLKNCSLYVNTNGTFNILSTNITPLNNQTNYFNNIYIDLGLQNWSVGCNDEEGNLGFALQNRTLNITGPDLRIRTADIYFGDEQRIEGVNITIYANISNVGLTTANNSFIAQFFKGDPDAGGIQIDSNIIIANLTFGTTITISTTKYVLAAGKNIIYVRVDAANTVNETNENNNKANNNVSVTLYQYYYGNVSKNIILGSNFSDTFINFENNTPEEGNLFFTDADSSFSFSDLKALTRNINNQLVGDDFSNLDTAMNTTIFDDSIKNIWGGGTDSPLQTRQFNTSLQNITDVPIINSTITSDFVTGILWDIDDDQGNLQYDATDKEDVVFITNINPQKAGEYGTYDTEIKIPATLRNYKSGSDKVVFYVELY